MSNGHYACGVVLGVNPKEDLGTKMFLAGLLGWTGITKPTREELELAQPTIVARGKAHIKTIAANGAAIEGIIDLGNNGSQTVSEQVQNTWGYNFINIKAESLLVQ